MYLANCIRHDIAYAIGILSWYTQSSNQNHWVVIRRVSKYLKGTIYYCLCYNGFPNVCEEFSDTNWIFDSYEMNFINEYVFNLEGGAISLKSSKQTCIIQSTMETRFIALEKASSKDELLRNLIMDIPLWTRQHCLCLYVVITKLH